MDFLLKTHPKSSSVQWGFYSTLWCCGDYCLPPHYFICPCFLKMKCKTAKQNTKQCFSIKLKNKSKNSGTFEEKNHTNLHFLSCWLTPSIATLKIDQKSMWGFHGLVSLWGHVLCLKLMSLSGIALRGISLPVSFN